MASAFLSMNSPSSAKNCIYWTWWTAASSSDQPSVRHSVHCRDNSEREKGLGGKNVAIDDRSPVAAVMLHMSVVQSADVMNVLLAASCPISTSSTSGKCSTSETRYLTPPGFEAAHFREAVRNMCMLYLAKILLFAEDRSRLLL